VRQFGFLDGGKQMNLTRWLMVAALGMLSYGRARAASIPPDDGHYLIDLEGWDADEEFGFMPNIPTPPGTSACLPAGAICGDASIRIDNGGGSTGESGDFMFNSGTGTETLFFDNEGGPITSIEITTILNADELQDFFSCSGGALFQTCGFILDPAGAPVGTLEMFFSDPYSTNGIVTATPEPSQWIILALAFAGIIAVRARKQFANSSFAQTQRLACRTLDS
jgi:hypothetical protein